MRTTILRTFLLSTCLAHAALAGVGCATAEDDGDLEDVDGVGKGDGWNTTSPERLADIPFYFSVPKAAVVTPLQRQLYPYPTLWNKSTHGDEVGLRVIAVRQGASVPERKTARRDMARKLAAAGVLQDGDIVLTFRPELADTMAYPHIQMGSTHAGLVYTDGGAAYNIDSPLDGQYVGQFDTSHYAGDGGDDAGTDALHIVRPRVMNDNRRASLREWVGALKRNLPRINGQRAQVKFQSDYLVPAFVSHGMTTKQTVTTLGKIILETDTTTKLPMYCSEFAWHMIALSGCTADEIRSAPASGADCVGEAFAPMGLAATSEREIGIAEGPLLSLMALPADRRPGLVSMIFSNDGGGNLSSGHRAVAEAVSELMVPLSVLYTDRADGKTVAETARTAAEINIKVPPNYSPTAYLVAAMGDGATRPTDYVATIAFVNGATYDKAKVIAQQPVP
ncbi:MAG: hypothetical protein KBG28_16905 [Kofleriaceae bacterium]|nr:hypothetical protein [Kofleriaceae bacterium]